MPIATTHSLPLLLSSMSWWKRIKSWFSRKLEKEVVWNIHFCDGAYVVMMNGRIDTIRYNTGDRVWFSQDDKEFRVIQYLTHDGQYWHEKGYVWQMRSG